MRFDPMKDPAACAATDSDHYNLRGVAIARFNGKPYCAATDGRILSMIAADLDDDDEPTETYPAEPFARARKVAPKGLLARVRLNGTAKLLDADGNAIEFQTLTNRFPDVEHVISTEAPKFSIQLNADYLQRAQHALGAQALRIEVGEDNTPVRLVPIYVPDPKSKKRTAVDDGSFCVLMPIGK